ncbi:hypothetical protein PoB_001067900 [Plakobranchus ocellatus]|uniref:Uncharacterized protein n=1 Tax=Plakobranchus ocellatus TaxID=259542 RepID=A0AAV3YQ59_9GAST|nr:hypothetical protein PoB_001067900 [Plakobranchus ocellatus]
MFAHQSRKKDLLVPTSGAACQKDTGKAPCRRGEGTLTRNVCRLDIGSTQFFQAGDHIKELSPVQPV